MGGRARPNRLRAIVLASVVAASAALLEAGPPAGAVPAQESTQDSTGTAAGEVRFATFNASLNRNTQGRLVADLSTPSNAQARTAAEIVQRTQPDVLLINEFDFDAQGQAAQLFNDNYLAVPQGGATPIDYPHHYVAPSNTGVPSGMDFNNDGTIGGGDDAFGFGAFPGQFGMAVYSHWPIQEVRTFQNFLWRDMPGGLLPDNPATPQPGDFYSPDELEVFRLSSKSHWDLTIDVAGSPVHFLVSHPTPPVFDGAEDRNGRRNSDEIRFWADYVTPGAGDYVYDDDGREGGLGEGAAFVIAGDQNSDPQDGDSVPGSIQQLLDNPLVNTSLTPDSEGAVDAANRQGGANNSHRSDHRFDTADFADTSPGNLRADYVLPSTGLDLRDGAVFWPPAGDPLFPLVGNFPFPSSDHRLVWVDVVAPPGPVISEAPFAAMLPLAGVALAGAALAGHRYRRRRHAGGAEHPVTSPQPAPAGGR